MQIPDRLAATDDIRLEGEGKIVLARRNLVGYLSLDDISCRQFAIWWRGAGENRFGILLTRRVFQGELEQRREILLIFADVLDRHINDDEGIAALGLADLVATVCLERVNRYDVGVAHLDLIAYLEMLARS